VHSIPALQLTVFRIVLGGKLVTSEENASTDKQTLKEQKTEFAAKASPSVSHAIGSVSADAEHKQGGEKKNERKQKDAAHHCAWNTIGGKPTLNTE
jgi:hypothetical protein